MEENLQHLFYLKGILVIVLTNILYKSQLKIIKSSFVLILVLIQIWVFLAIAQGFENMFFKERKVLFSLLGFGFLLAESLPMLLLFGGTTILYVSRPKKEE